MYVPAGKHLIWERYKALRSTASHTGRNRRTKAHILPGPALVAKSEFEDFLTPAGILRNDRRTPAFTPAAQEAARIASHESLYIRLVAGRQTRQRSPRDGVLRDRLTDLGWQAEFESLLVGRPTAVHERLGHLARQ